MSKGDVLGFSVAGLVVWLAAAVFYAAFGARLLETSFWFYALNAFLAAGAMLFVFHALARVTRTWRRRRLAAAMAFAAPGLIGTVLALANFAAVFPHLDPISAGRFGAFMVVGYLAVFGSVFERRTAQKA